MVKKVLILFALGAALLVAMGFMQRGDSGTPSMAGTDVGGKIVYARGGALWMYSGGKEKQLTAGPKEPLG